MDIITQGGNASRDLSVLGVELLCAAWEFVLIVSECLFVSSVLYVVSTLVGVDICIYGLCGEDKGLCHVSFTDRSPPLVCWDGLTEPAAY